MSALRLKKSSRLAARLRQQIGAGCFYPYQLAGEAGVLRLALTEHPRGEMSHWQCAAGTLAFSDAQSVLSLMSACPTFTSSDALTEQPWYWPLWHQQLSGELLALFGHITVTEDNDIADELLLTMTLEWGARRAQSLLALSATSLAQLLGNAGWQQNAMPLPSEIALTLPVVVGEVTLTKMPERGDVVLPQTLFFTPDGRGRIRCAGRVLQGQIETQPGTLAHFYLSEMENYDVTLPPDDFEQPISPDPHWDCEPMSEATDFSPLPLALSVRCGQLRLTLGELANLAPGAMVMIDHVTPGEALLCHGDYPLAKGELVDVEGRLGLQITQMLPGGKNPLAR